MIDQVTNVGSGCLISEILNPPYPKNIKDTLSSNQSKNSRVAVLNGNHSRSLISNPS